jgi:hypothetical protein
MRVVQGALALCFQVETVATQKKPAPLHMERNERFFKKK